MLFLQRRDRALTEVPGRGVGGAEFFRRQRSGRVLGQQRAGAWSERRRRSKSRRSALSFCCHQHDVAGRCAARFMLAASNIDVLDALEVLASRLSWSFRRPAFSSTTGAWPGRRRVRPGRCCSSRLPLALGGLTTRGFRTVSASRWSCRGVCLFCLSFWSPAAPLSVSAGPRAAHPRRNCRDLALPHRLEHRRECGPARRRGRSAPAIRTFTLGFGLGSFFFLFFLGEFLDVGHGLGRGPLPRGVASRPPWLRLRAGSPPRR